MNLLKREKYQPVIIAFVALCVFIFIILQYTEFYNDNKEKDIRGNLLELLVSKKARLEKALNSRIYYTKGIAAYTSINPEITSSIFYQLADKLIQGDTVISTMSISKDCILNAIYPLKGHESALGLDLLKHPGRKKIVQSTIETGNTFIAGPVELVEGGVAFLSYTPIFAKNQNDSSKFWGVTDIVIWKEKLFNELKFYSQDDNYKYALRGVDGSGINGPCFFGSDEVFNENPEIVDILLPTGNWTLASVPIKGWKSYLNKTEIITIILYISAFIISILIWLLTRAMMKIRAHEVELNALFGAMQDLIIEFNSKGEYIKIAPTNESLLVLPSKEILGKSLHQVFDKEKADYFLEAITRCIRTKKMVILDYPLEINSQILWFQARISYLTDNSVIYVAHDNTQKKKAEEKLIDSEQKLTALNATKDKLFSIIAHDLRSPFNATLGLTEILTEDIEDLGKDEIKVSVGQISSALKIQFGLLENLLNWSQMQTEKMEFIKKNINLKKHVENSIKIFSANALPKRIEMINKIDPATFILADENMLSSIMNNLISNAIKFTKDDGTVSVSSMVTNTNVQVTVSDTGIGMNSEEASKIFNIDMRHSTLGTKGEKGTGLGLALIKDMIKKHEGRIWVESEEGKGSSFIFTIPI